MQAWQGHDVGTPELKFSAASYKSDEKVCSMKVKESYIIQVVHEQLEELIFSEPAQAFHQRVTNQVQIFLLLLLSDGRLSVQGITSPGRILLFSRAGEKETSLTLL